MEEAERRTVIQQAQLNIDQLKATVHNIEHKREEDMHSTSMMSRDKDSMLATERSQMASRLAEISDEQNKKLLQKEIRLREEAQSKFMALEKVKADIQNLLEQSKESGIKGLADMDTRVGKLSRRMQDAEEALASLDKVFGNYY
ncbi:predicted protein [Nematostella vectensis]|uniref:Uncharacterized protein n=1 Tax=Nematostella vectensis TaxID=45351 RepID=A7TCT5_NEMVE|nr:predicted protein [Nematostella vectensis]|eukprot:XP_001618229.1 hypothetical protein NEMVEDRAFT_v1g225370 [Nematostella vectensis]